MKEVPFEGKSAEKGSKDFTDRKKQQSGKLSTVRTYRADVEELLTKKKITRTHIAIAEEERRRAIGESALWEEQKASSILPLIIAAVFLLVGVGILLYDLVGKNVPIVSRNMTPGTFLVPGDKSQILGLTQYTRDELTKGIRTIVRGQKLAQGDHIRIGFRAQTDTDSLPLPLKTFLLTLEGSVPDTFSRSLTPEYEGGLMSAGETKGYLIFTTSYYENTAVGLLSWERQMMRDLYPIIDPLRAELLPDATEGMWRAQTWDGNDLRVFTTTDGRVALVYGWVKKKTLIIAGSIQVFTELARSMRDSSLK